jgi:hypothetical protein
LDSPCRYLSNKLEFARFGVHLQKLWQFWFYCIRPFIHVCAIWRQPSAKASVACGSTAQGSGSTAGANGSTAPCEAVVPQPQPCRLMHAEVGADVIFYIRPLRGSTATAVRYYRVGFSHGSLVDVCAAVFCLLPLHRGSTAPLVW